MIKYKGAEKVNVFSELLPSVPGGMMVSNGHALGAYRQPLKAFYFVRNGQKHRVTNVRTEGLHQANKLRGL